MNNIAIIPARSGSKGLKDKNIAEVDGIPLIGYTISAAVDSGCFDTVMVSTDSEKYAEIARSCGAEVPFLRSEACSGDAAGSWDVVREVIINYQRFGKSFDNIALLQPTSPLRDSQDIKRAFELLAAKQANAVVSVTEVEHPIQWCFTLDESLSLLEYSKSPYTNMRRQNLEVHYQENGAIYIVNAEKIISEEYNLYSDNCIAYIMDREKSIDIDSKYDLLLFKVLKQNDIDR